MGLRFVDLSGDDVDRAEVLAKGGGRFIQSTSEPETYVWSPWDVVPPREEEHAPEEDAQAAAVEANSLAIADLGVTVAEQAQNGTDVAQAVAELGVQVAQLVAASKG